MGIVLRVECIDETFALSTNARNPIVRAILRWVAEDVCELYRRLGRAPTKVTSRIERTTLSITLRASERTSRGATFEYNVKVIHG